MINKLILVGLLTIMNIITFGSYPQGVDFPVPPKQFSWQHCTDVKASFLRPKGWYFKEEYKEKTKAIFITKENVDKDKWFKTGLSEIGRAHV